MSESVEKRILKKKKTVLLAEISFFSSFPNGTFAIGVFFSFRFVSCRVFVCLILIHDSIVAELDVCVFFFFCCHHFLFGCCLRMHLSSRDGQIKDNSVITIKNNCLFATKHVFSV